MEKNRGNIYIFITAFLWSTGGLLIKWIPWSSMAINGVRSLIALVFFMIVRRSIKVKANRTILLAAICLTLTNTLYVMANKLTGAANAIILQYTAPIFVLLLTCIYERKKPKKEQVMVIGLALGGMVLFFFDKLEAGQLLGNVLAILAGVCFSGVFFFNSLPDSSGEDSSMIAFGLSFLIAIPFYQAQPALDGMGILALLSLGIFQVGLAYVIFSKGIKLTSAFNSSLIGLSEAIMNPLWVYLFMDEVLGKWTFLGACVVLGAILLNLLITRKQGLQERLAIEVSSLI